MARGRHPYHWIEKATENKGALRAKVHAKPGEPIPEKALAKAEHARSPTERREANLAATLRGFHGR